MSENKQPAKKAPKKKFAKKKEESAVITEVPEVAKDLIDETIPAEELKEVITDTPTEVVAEVIADAPVEAAGDFIVESKDEKHQEFMRKTLRKQYSLRTLKARGIL